MLHGDCLELIKDIPDSSVDLIVTDPPYEIKAHGGGGAFGSKKCKFFNEMEEAKLTKGFNDEILHELVRVMKKINIYIWCSKDQIRKYVDFFEDLGCSTDVLTWHKTNPVPTCNNKYLSDTEYLLFFREKGVKVFGTYSTKKKYYISPTNKNDKKLYSHPTIKPLDIIQNITINSSEEGATILDPFMGSGTTGVACLNTGRKFIGIEIDKDYFEIAKKRIYTKIERRSS